MITIPVASLIWWAEVDKKRIYFSVAQLIFSHNMIQEFKTNLGNVQE